MNSPFAVDVYDAEKRYGEKSNAKVAFTKLNLTVPRGSIYGLLGPSGCGKTTLLRCILGRLKLDKGSVLVFGHYPGSKESEIPGPAVGYMAQETTVYTTMTIGEYLYYFGAILGLSSKEIRSKTKYFIDLLRLPSKNTLITRLSGGQSRCVHFAAACIHKPKLLILDEPTVGIDVITKHRIWEHLVKLTRNNEMSVVLTTHYIEEARLADKVGMIHGGTMAAEDRTENLLTKYNETTLDAVFFKICYNESLKVVSDGEQSSVDSGKAVGMNHCQKSKTSENDVGISMSGAGGSDDVKEEPQQALVSKSFSFSVTWHRLCPIMMRTFISLYRFPGALLLLVLLPSSQIFMYSYLMSHRISGIQMGIINNDLGHLGAQYLTYLDNDTIIQKHYRDYDDGFQALRIGELQGIIYIKSNFSAVVHKRFTDFVLSSEELVKAGTIDIQMDNTNLHAAKFAEFHLLKKFQHFLHETLDLAGFNPAIGRLPINISEETEKRLVQPPSMYVLSGEIVLACLFASIPVSIFNIFMERQQGYMESNLIAGVTPVEIVLGMILGQLVILIIQVAGVILAAPPLYSAVNKGSLFLIFCLLYVQGLCGTTLGIFLSLLCDQLTMLFVVTSSIICFGAALTGVFWPIEAMPSIFRQFCLFLPTAVPTRALTLIVHRGWDLYDFSILSAFGISFVWMFIFLGISLLLFYFKK